MRDMFDCFCIAGGVELYKDTRSDKETSGIVNTPRMRGHTRIQVKLSRIQGCADMFEFNLHRSARAPGDLLRARLGPKGRSGRGDAMAALGLADQSLEVRREREWMPPGRKRENGRGRKRGW